ncbi:hypothetical protein IHQ71_26870 [Rhizobium sp. TH2]|uniref:Abi-alpha family protein n=1 Tax=Rhizobium sp. TH2 TaxID=2775403 RepID=UPI00215755EC|nr:hypothetical protein [Rhizobium sp. TH2]UVC08707.1 hypothetical protein IHQ71_26870 [Rhizobium sp. TH2]
MGDEHKPPINLELGASVKAEFKAEIKAEIPSTSMGRLVDAVTDAIRPFTEARGLKADQIRLQREDVLIEVARRASVRLQIEKIDPQPIPAKTLVPLLEKASLEDPEDDEMIERWAALLAAEARDPGPNRRWFIEILSSLDGWQVKLLDAMGRSSHSREFFRVQNYTRAQVSEGFSSVVDLCAGNDVSKIRKKLGALPGYTMFFNGEDIPNTNEFEFKDIEEASSLLHLDALGLAWVNAASFVGSDERHFVLNAQLSPLGYQFVALFQPEEQR